MVCPMLELATGATPNVRHEGHVFTSNYLTKLMYNITKFNHFNRISGTKSYHNSQLINTSEDPSLQTIETNF